MPKKSKLPPDPEEMNEQRTDAAQGAHCLRMASTHYEAETDGEGSQFVEVA